AQSVQPGLEAGLLVAFPGGLQGIAERESEFSTALLQQDQILHRGLGGLHLGLHVGNLVAVDLSDGDAEWIIHTGSSAGQDVDEALRMRIRDKKYGRRGSGGCNQSGVHENHSPLILVGKLDGRRLRVKSSDKLKRCLRHTPTRPLPRLPKLD